MHVSWRIWVGAATAACLLLALAGCLPDQQYSGGRPLPGTSAVAQRAGGSPPSRELVLTGGQQPGLPAPEHLPEATPLPSAKLSLTQPVVSLRDLIELALHNHPDLLVAQAKVEAMRGKMIQSSLYPNPRVSLDWDAINTRDATAGDPGALIAQEIVTAHKLEIARAAGAAGVQAADFDAVTHWYDVVVNVRHAYVDLLAARRAEVAVREIVKVAEANLDAANKLFKAGAGSKLDILRAETELEQARVQQTTVLRRTTANEAILAAAVGVPGLPAAEVVGSLEQAAPRFAWPGLLAQVLAVSSEVQAAEARVLQMQQLVRRAEAERIPNVHTELRPFYSSADRNTQVEVIVGADLPVFNRNQGNILTARANLAQAQAEVRQTELSLSRRLTEAYRRYQVGVEQAEAYRSRILPKARESLALVRVGYQNGDPKYNLTAVLQAQQILFQAEVSYVSALDELWRAVADIEGLMQLKLE